MNNIFGISFIQKKAQYKHVADMFCQEDETINQHTEMLVFVLPAL